MLFYIAQLFQVGLAIVAAPIYLSIFGTGGYGIIAIGLLILLWLQLFETGFSQTVGRDFAIGSTLDVRQNVLAGNVKFCYLALISISLILLIFQKFFASNFLSNWLSQDHNTRSDLTQLIELAIIVGAIRIAAATPRAVIYGAGRLNELGLVLIVFSIARLAGVICIFYYLGIRDVRAFFYSQISLSFIEMVILIIMSSKILSLNFIFRSKFEKFSLIVFCNSVMSITGASIVWAIATTADRVWFSRILSLHDFAILSLIVMIAGGIGATSAPLMTTFLPNFCKRYSLNISLEEKYEDFDRIVSIYIAVATITASPMILRSFDVLYGWTNDIAIANAGEVTLIVYAIGFLLQAIGGLVYFLQYARGDMSQHLKGSIFFAVTYMITLSFLGARFGIVGAAFAWVIVNIIYICTWVFYTASQFGEKFLKLIVFWAPIKAAILPLFCCYILLFILPTSMERYLSIFNIMFVLISCFLLQLLTNRHFRIFFRNFLYRLPVT